jgi:hypothetical protein
MTAIWPVRKGQAWDIGDAVPLVSEMEIVPTAVYDVWRALTWW